MKHAMTIAAAFALAACGGGGDAGGRGVVVPDDVRTVNASAGSDLSASNIDSFTGPAARMVMSLTGDSFLQTPVASERGARSLMRAAFAARERAQVVTTETLACDFGGSMTVRVDDADNNERPTRGDSVDITASNCLVEAGQPATNGRFTFAFNAVELDNSQALIASDVSGSFVDFRVGNLAQLNGAFRMWIDAKDTSADRIRISYNDVVSSLAGEELVYNIDVYGLAGPTSQTLSLNGGLGIGGHTYAVVQQTDFTIAASGVPSAGALRLRDAAGDTLLLRAKPAGRLDFEFTPVGTTAPTATRLDQTWDSFRRN